MQQKILAHLATPEEQGRDDFLKISADNFQCLEFLKGRQLLLQVDWYGSEGSAQIPNFVEQRLHAFNGPTCLVNLEKVAQKFEKALKAGKVTGTLTPEGAYTPFLLKEFDRELKKIDFSVILLDRGTTEFYVVIVPLTNAKKLRKIKDEFWRFVSLRYKGGVLYCYDCPSCDTPNIFHFENRNEPFAELAGSNCDGCNTPLVNEAGEALVEFEEDYF